MKIKSITIKRFKRLEEVTFNVGDLNILIGGNNSGKSTIIQAVHFAFTLFQSLTISKKWPAKGTKSTTISPSELIYIPSEDPYTLGYGGRLLEDEARAINLSFVFENGETASVSVRKGRITNILVEPENADLARGLSGLGSPYTVFSPGLAGVSRTENYVSDGVLLRVLARGDANIVLRNILYRLNQKAEWAYFLNDLTEIFPDVGIAVSYDPAIDQFISVNINESKRQVPLDLAGTGLLQAIQILAYLHLFSPKIIILDEPDSHLHPNNQRLLCSLLSSISSERGVQVLITTHSRHVLDTMYSEANILWVQEGAVKPVSPEDQVDMLLELGALDVKEKIQSGKASVIFLTEDRITPNLSIILKNSGFKEEATEILPYNGVTSTHLLKPLVRQIKEISKAAIFVHRDRDYLTNAEVDDWEAEIRKIGAEPFVTKELDVEGYFSTTSYLEHILANRQDIGLGNLLAQLEEGEEADTIAAYVNGRIEQARKTGSIAQLNLGKLSAEAAQLIHGNPIAQMKGKRKIAKLRQILHQTYGFKFEIDKKAAIPSDPELALVAKKYFK